VFRSEVPVLPIYSQLPNLFLNKNSETKTFGPPIKGYIGALRTQGYEVKWTDPKTQLSDTKAKNGGKKQKKASIFKRSTK